VATEGYAPFNGWQTWYRVEGDLGAEPAPLVTLHGGPGAAHDYLVSLSDLTRDGRAVVYYDQLGNGRSTHLRERMADGDFWTPALFVRELQNLVEHLGIAGRHHVLGQSWGSFLAQEYALTQPQGLRALVLANAAASFPDFLAECNRLRRELPPDVEAMLRLHEQAETTDDPEYMEACQVFYRRHVCRLDEWPQAVLKAFEWIDEDPTVYHTMNGPSEFHVIGTLKDWNVKDRLGEIRVPTLVVCGRYDETTPALLETLAAGVAGAESHVFEESSHLPFWEEREAFMSVVGDFLARHD
jgi:L-proline amide hydrolase